MKFGLRSLAAGQYVPTSSPVHRTDARLKLGLGFAVAGALLAVGRWEGLACLAVGICELVALAQVPLAYVWRSVYPFLIVLAITFIAQATAQGLLRGAFVAGRLTLLLVWGALLVITMPPAAITDALAWYLRPLRPLGVPVGDLALVMSLALRFIPVLMAEADQLVKAQRARGIEISSRTLGRAARALFPLVVPLFVLAFKRAEDTAEAMVSRCYRGAAGRTYYRTARFGRVDWVGLGVGALWLAASLVLGRVSIGGMG